ncbi:nuclear transport factor 2 family protein [Paraburkholderia sediminicola]|uniref:nuclear transport factor 2 family protein n=1 Tax=Paraburkholderia sediminicola TaxID=458836 RepID=UPI0038B8F181
MSSTVSRQQLLDLLANFCDTWAGTPSMPAADLFAHDVELFSSYRGNAHGREEVLGLLRGDFAGLEAVRISATNRVPRVSSDDSVVGAYVYGQAQRASRAADGEAALFGGVLVLSFESRESRLFIRTIRFQLSWAEGVTALLAGWQLPPMNRAWRPGDQPAVVVSEMDSPWHRIPVSELPISDEDAIAEAWFRYVWALDQADFVLFEQSFSENIEAELTPMGRMKGRRTLMGTLKAFRLPWPWMQHYGVPVQVEIEPDGNSAALLLGRITPGQTQTPEGKQLYSAHYRIRTVRSGGESWQISQMEYIPGWISFE